MALGPRVKPKTAVRRVPLNLKVPPALRKSMEKAADRSGRSLGAEVEYRVSRYDDLERMVGILERALAPPVLVNPGSLPGNGYTAPEITWIAPDGAISKTTGD